MAVNDLIICQSLVCLRLHFHPEWGDRHLLDVLNRLLAKHINPVGWTANTHLNIRLDQVTSRQEKWTVAQLAELKRGHGGTTGQDVNCPIIIIDYQGERRLLDGNHRINRWIKEGDAQLHTVNIHTIDVIGEFVELLPSAPPMPS